MILLMTFSMRRSLVVALVGAGSALALSGAALAEDPVDTQYGNGASKISQQQPQVVPQPPTTATSPSSAPTSPSSAPASSTTPASTDATKPATTSTPSKRAVAAAGDETLPLTGLDLGFAVVIGFVAAVAGFALRRAGRSSSS